MADKMLDRISKLLNQAERAEEGSPERDAFMEKAMALAQATSIDLAVARAHQANKEKVEFPEKRRYKIGAYHNERVYHHGDNEEFATGDRLTIHSKWLTELFNVIAESNDLRQTFGHNGVYVYCHGFPSDMEVTERLYSVLSVQMMHDADAAIKRGEHKNLREPRWVNRNVPNPDYDPTQETYRDNWGGPEWINPKTRVEQVMVTAIDGRVFRANFYQGFIQRVRSRLWEAKQAAERAAGVTSDASTESGIAVRDKKQEVDALYKEETKFVRGTYSGAEVKQDTSAGRDHGREAGARANMGITPDVEFHRKIEVEG
jgi:hypothetical protein